MRFILALPVVAAFALGEAALPVAAGAQEVDRAHTLVWGVAATPASLDPGFHYSLEALEVNRNVNDSLVKYGTKVDPVSGLVIPDFTKYEGMLAERWWLEDDGKTIVIKLREGVLSHFGNELTADDAIFGFQRAERVKSTQYTFTLAGLGVTDVDRQVQKVDKYTFKFLLDAPNAIWQDWLTHNNHFIQDTVELQKHFTESDPEGLEWTSRNNPGFGPYKIVRFTPGQEVVLEAHQEYWNRAEEPQFFQRIIEREIPSSSNRRALLLSGDIDAARDLTLNELQQLQGNPAVKALSFAGNMLTRVEFNNTVPPFDNPLVRKALSYAVPYEAILDSVYLGFAQQSKSVNPSTYLSYADEFWQYSTNVDEAKRLLAEAGYPDGFTTTIEIESGLTEAEQIAILLRDAFSEIGVDLQIQKLLTGDFYTKVNQGGFEGMWLFRDAAGIPDGGFGVYLWLTSTSQVNPGKYINAEVDELFAETTTSLDAAAREESFRRIQEIVVWEDPAWLFIAEPGYHLGVRAEIDGIAWNTISEIRWGRAFRN